MPRSDDTEMLVIGTPLSRTAGSAHVVRNNNLERFEYDDPQAVLAAVPGVYARGEDGIGLRPNIGLRGVNPDRSKKVTLMEDGVLFGPAPYSAPAAYYFPLMTRMTQVRVIKGPGSVIFGPQTVGGAIELITMPLPNETVAGLDIAGGQYLYNKAHGFFGSALGPASFLIEGVHIGSDGFKELASGADTGFYRNEWMVRGGYEFDDVGQELQLKLTYSDELSNETYLGLTDEDFRAAPLQRYFASELDRMRNHRTSIVLTHIADPSDELSITTQVYRNDYYRIWRKVNRFRGMGTALPGEEERAATLFDVLADPDTPRNSVFVALLRGEADSTTAQETLFIGPNERDFVSQGVQSRLSWDVETGPLEHRIEVGARVHNDLISRRHSEDGFLLIDGTLVAEGTATQVTAFNEAWAYALSAFATDAISWGDLIVTPGARVEAIRSGTDNFLSGTNEASWAYAFVPGIGAYYGITREFGVLAGVHRGFSPPAPGAEEPEYSVNYEAGMRYDRRTARAEVIGFYNDYSNMTDICTFSSGCAEEDLDQQFDAGKARIYGLEAFVEMAPSFGRFTLPVTLAYTLTQAEFENTFSSEDPIFGEVVAGDEMPYIPEHQFTGIVGLEHAVAGIDISLTYVAAMRELAGSEPLDATLATDPQLLLGASVYVRPIPQIELYLDARNLLDEHDIVSRRPFGARPNAPLTILGGAKFAL